VSTGNVQSIDEAIETRKTLSARAG